MLVTQEALEQMMAHARREYPLECCGLLAGVHGLIDEVTPAGNELQSSREFRIPSVELIRFLKRTRREGRDFLGVYHSHPSGGGCPSLRDAEEFYYPDVSYWVISTPVSRPRVGCFSWQGNRFVSTPFDVVYRGADGKKRNDE